MIFPSAFRALVNRVSIASTVLVALCQTALSGASNLPSAADGFDPNVSGNVFALAQQSDGKIIVGGSFGLFQANGGGQEGRNNIARVGIDGIVDTTFNPNANGQVNATLVQPDGKIVIGGSFTTVGGVNRNHVARLNADGTVDASFNPNATSTGSNADVNSLALQPDGKIIIGGAFTSMGGLTRNRIARVTSTGAVDSFDPNASNVVNAIAVQTDGKIVIGGGFTALQPNGAAAAITRNRAARLNVDGSVDTTFDPNVNNLVSAIAIQLDGKIVMGGSFTSVQPSGSDTATTRNHLVRFGNDGSLDTTFDPNADKAVSAIALQPDGKIVVGGTFGSLRPQSTSVVGRSFLARLNVDGTVDTRFNAGPNNQVSAIVVQSDGSLVLGGYFSQLLAGTSNAISTARNHLARVNPEGLLDITFDPNARGAVLVQAVQSNGAVIIGGTFSSVGGATRSYLARVATSGTLDSAYDPNPNGAVQALALQSDGKLLVGGSFTTIAGDTRNRLTRLTVDGQNDGGFNPNLDGAVSSIAVQSDGKILVGGSFTTVAPNGATASTARNYLLRLNADGSLDTAFAATPNAQVTSIVIQSDGKIIIAGSFSAVLSSGAQFQTARNSIARLNVDGTLDNNYNPNPNSGISTMALQSDGKLLIGGTFSALLPGSDLTSTTRSRMARLTTDGKVDAGFDPNFNSAIAIVQSIQVQSDNKILVGGAFRTLQPNGTANFVTRNYLVRLNADGSVDPAFDPNPNGSVRAISVLSDQRILVGGAFSAVQPTGTASATQRFHLARLAANGTLDTSFDPSVGGQAGGQVSAIAVQTNGRFLIAGSFGDTGGSTSSNLSRFNPDATPDQSFSPDADGPINAIGVRPNSEAVATQASGFAFLNSDGSFRSGFNVGSNVRINGQVLVVATQADKKILIGGSFVNTTGATGRNLLRLLPDGRLDTSFNPDPDGAVYSIAFQSDTTIVVGGAFANIGGQARSRIARLNGDGAADTFNPTASGTVYAVAVQTDGKILLGGAFTTLAPNGAATPTTRNYIARVAADGTVDTAYNPSANAELHAIALQSDGKAVIGGAFTNLTPNSGTAATRNFIARLNTDGTLDTGYDPSANAAVLALAIQPNGSVLMGGNFTSVGGWDTPYINRTSGTGANDPNFAHRANAPVDAIALQPDGKILIGGAFTTFDNLPRNRAARLNADNSLDTTFNPNADAQISFIATQSDGSILLGGAFSTLRPLGAIYVGGSFANIGGAAVANLALINDDGSASTNFRPNPNGAVFALAVQADNRTLVGGNFTSIVGAGRNRIARLAADGSLDASFNPNADNQVSAIGPQADGKILVGGTFTAVGGAARNRLARLNADGSADAFNPNADGAVNVIAVQADGKVIVGGTFGSVGGAARSRIARLNADGSADGSFNPGVDGEVNAVIVQADGKILVGGAFGTIGGTARSNVARLNADGSIDASFDPGADGSVLALSMGSDGKLLLGGTFGRVAGLPRNRFARLAPTSLATQTLSTANNMSTVVWTRSGGAPELSGATFDTSTDGSTWTALGQGSRVGTTSSWTLSGLSLPSSSVFYLRARGVVPSSEFASSGLTETIRWLTPAPVVTSPSIIGGTLASPFYYAASSASGASSFSASGLPAGLTLDPLTGIISGTPTQSGSFAVVVTANNAGGTTTTALTISIAAAGGSGGSGSRLVSLAARARVSASNPLIAGFVVGGSEAKSVLLRGIGPGLTAQGVQSALATPEVRLYNANGQLVLTAGSWGGQASLAAVFSSVGAFSLASGSADAATVATLQPGVYTMQVVDPRGVGGIALAEIYDVTPTAGPKLVEISARGSVDSGDGVLIGGLVITGSAPKRVMLRAAGASLAALGVTNSLQDPTLKLFNSQSQVIASNDNWETPVTVSAAFPGATSAEISAASASAGAFPFLTGAKDSATIVTLPPGNYTVQVAGVNNATGVALVEIYELP